MCAGPFKPSPPPPPPPIPEEESVRQQRERLRKQEQTDRSKLKQQQFEDRVAAYTGQRGRRSLLTGRRGGEGFNVNVSLMSKDTLGA
jgi:hypothetical protein